MPTTTQANRPMQVATALGTDVLLLAGFSGREAISTLFTFQLDLLWESGYLPELTTCAECGFPAGEYELTYFSPNRGGVVCRNCEGVVPDRMSIDLRLLRLVQTILRLPRDNGAAQRLPRLTRHQTDPINRMLADHVEHTLGRRLRMVPYVVQ